MNEADEATSDEGLAAMAARIEELAAQVKAVSKQCRTLKAKLGPGPINPDRLYKPGELAVRFRSSLDNIHDLVASKEIRVVCVGTALDMKPRFNGSDIIAFLNEREEGVSFEP